MAETIRNRASLGLQCVAFVFLALITLDGRHPPAHAQTASSRPAQSTIAVVVDESAVIRADQRRDDNLLSLQSQVDANRLSLQKQWDAVNSLKEAVVKNTAAADQATLDAKAGHGSNTTLDVGMMASILASIGLQLRNNRRGKSRRARDPDDEG
jgi:hypothetical protein